MELLIVNANPVPTITGVTSICQGQSSTLNAGPGYSAYVWSTGINTQTLSVNTAGTYSVTVTDANGCVGNTSQPIVVNSLPTPTVTGITDICFGNSTTLDAGAGYSGYQWNGGGITQTISASASGQYTVTVTDANGCTGTSSSLVTVNALPVPVI